jgi:hypothetical protein
VVNGELVIDLFADARRRGRSGGVEEPLSTIQNTRVHQHDDQRSILGPDRADLGGEARRVAGGVRVPAAQIAAASAFRPRTSRPALDLRGPGCGALVLVPAGTARLNCVPGPRVERS